MRENGHKLPPAEAIETSVKKKQQHFHHLQRTRAPNDEKGVPSTVIGSPRYAAEIQNRGGAELDKAGKTCSSCPKNWTEVPINTEKSLSKQLNVGKGNIIQLKTEIWQPVSDNHFTDCCKNCRIHSILHCEKIWNFKISG